MKTVLIKKSSSEEIESQVGEIFRFFNLSVKGKRVLVKPNILGPHPRSHQTTTHPKLVSAVVKEVRKQGGEPTVGDNPGVAGYGMNEKSAFETGIQDAAGGCFKNIGRESVRVKTGASDLGEIPVSRIVKETDLIISLPRFKTHALTQLTGAIKNSFGFIPGGEKARLHARFPDWRTFSEIVVHVYAVRPPDLVIMDAFTAMEGNGPAGAPLRELNRVLASDDGVSVDAVMAEMAGLGRKRFVQLDTAHELGIGEGDIDNIKIEGDFVRISNFRMPSRPATCFAAPWVNRLAFPFFHQYPVIDVKNCVLCRRCADNCPVEAIKGDFKLEVDKKRCISCYCCLENCPENAILIKRNAGMRMVDFGVKVKNKLINAFRKQDES